MNNLRLLALLQMFIYSSYCMKCNATQLPNDRLTNYKNVSYLQITRQDNKLSYMLFVPVNDGYWGHSLDEPFQRYNYNNQKQGNRDNVQLMVDGELFYNVFYLQDFIHGEEEFQQLDPNFNLGVTFIDGNRHTRLAEDFQLEMEQQTTECQYNLQIQLEDLVQGLYYKVKIHQSSSGDVQIVFWFSKKDFVFFQNESYIFFQLGQNQSKFQAQVLSITKPLNENHDIVEQRAVQILDETDTTAPIKRVLNFRQGTSGRQMNDNLQTQEQLQQGTLRIPQWTIISSLDIPNYEFFQIQDSLKFYQFALKGKVQEDLTDIVGFHFKIDQTKKITVLAARNMSQQNQDVLYLEDNLRFSDSFLQNLKKLTITYVYKETKIVQNTINFYDRSFQQGFEDIHFMSLKKSEIQEGYKLLIIQRPEDFDKQGDKHHYIQIMLKPSSQIQQDKQYYRRRQDVSQSQQNSVSIQTQFSQQDQNLQNDRSTVHLNFLIQRLHSIQEQQQSNLTQQYAIQQQTASNDQEQNSGVIDNSRFFKIIYRQQDNAFEILNQQGEHQYQYCAIAKDILDQQGAELTSYQFAIQLNNSNEDQQDNEDENQTINLSPVYVSDQGQDFVYLFDSSELQDADQEKLNNNYCFARIKDGYIILNFGGIQDGIILDQYTSNDKSRKTLHIVQTLYMIKQNKIDAIIQSKDAIKYKDWNKFNKNQNLMINSYKGQGTFNMENEFFQNFDTQNDRLYMRSMLENEIEIIKKRRSIHNFVVEDGNQKEHLITQVNMFKRTLKHDIYYAMLTEEQQVIVFKIDFENKQIQVKGKTQKQQRLDVVQIKGKIIENILNESNIVIIHSTLQQELEGINQKSEYDVRFGSYKTRNSYLYLYQKDLQSTYFVLNIIGQYTSKFYVKTQLVHLSSLPEDQMVDFDTLDNSKKIESKVQSNKINFEILPEYKSPDGQIQHIMGFDANFDGSTFIYSQIMIVSNDDFQKSFSKYESLLKDKEDLQNNGERYTLRIQRKANLVVI